jgi:hypothetical protein
MILGKNREFKHLYNAITSSPKKERYFGLMGVFNLDIREKRIQIQTFTGRLLLKVKPKPAESCEAALFRLLPFWDVSAEEVIFYIREQFGKEEVTKAVINLKNGQLTEREIAQLDSVIYWLGCRER